jgi:hypothetical protein
MGYVLSPGFHLVFLVLKSLAHVSTAFRFFFQFCARYLGLLAGNVVIKNRNLSALLLLNVNVLSRQSLAIACNE